MEKKDIQFNGASATLINGTIGKCIIDANGKYWFCPDFGGSLDDGTFYKDANAFENEHDMPCYVSEGEFDECENVLTYDDESYYCVEVRDTYNSIKQEFIDAVKDYFELDENTDIERIFPLMYEDGEVRWKSLDEALSNLFCNLEWQSPITEILSLIGDDEMYASGQQ